MHQTNFTKHTEFINEVEKLKLVNRANLTLGGTRPENSAEHSWHAALIAIVLAEYATPGVNINRVVKMLLIHDLVEIDGGDTWLYGKDQSLKAEKELRCAERLFGLLPEPLASELLNLWKEFEARKTEDARFAASIDGIQPLLNHLVTGDPTGPKISADRVRRKKEYIRQNTPQLWNLAEEAIKASIDRKLYEELSPASDAEVQF